MKTILIDLDSIKKNPNAGRTHFNQIGSTDITFKYEGEPNQYLIDKFNSEGEDDADGFFLTEISLPTHNKFICKGVLFDSSFAPSLLEKVPMAIIKTNNQVVRIETMPQPNYLYVYAPTKLKCKKCKNMVLVDDIESDYERIGEDEYRFEECPICENRNTFPEWKYERIDEALKRKQI